MPYSGAADPPFANLEDYRAQDLGFPLQIHPEQRVEWLRTKEAPDTDLRAQNLFSPCAAVEGQALSRSLGSGASWNGILEDGPRGTPETSGSSPGPSLQIAGRGRPGARTSPSAVKPSSTHGRPSDPVRNPVVEESRSGDPDAAERTIPHAAGSLRPHPVSLRLHPVDGAGGGASPPERASLLRSAAVKLMFVFGPSSSRIWPRSSR